MDTITFQYTPELLRRLAEARAFLIDMDGVLYDTMPFHARAWHRMISEQGIACTPEEFFLYEGMTGRATINLIFNRERGHAVSDEECSRLYAIKSGYFAAFGKKPKIRGIDALLESIRAHGLERVLVTGSGQQSVLDKLSDDFPGIFDADKRITAHDVRHGKPDPEPYLMGAERAGFSPEQCIVLENAPLGVRAGHDAGCTVIAMATGPIPEERLREEGADIVVPGPTEVLTLMNEIWKQG